MEFTQGRFLGDESAEVAYADARVAVLPCPYDGTSTYAKGADRGPEALLQASGQLELFDLELGAFPYRAGITTLPAVQFEGDDSEAAVVAIEKAARRAVDDDKFVFGLGGEHTVTVGLTRALRAARGSFSVLQIDAHADLRDSYDGSPYNHACVMRRLATDDGECKIVSVGIRACHEQELAFAEQRGIKWFPGHTLDPGGDWIEAACGFLSSPLYVTVDLDGLDPSIMPSTGTPVPGGLGWHQTLSLLRRAGETCRVIGADLTELKPDPVNHHSEFLAALLAYKMIGYFVPAKT